MPIQITDIQLPERSASKIISILESNAMPVRVPVDLHRINFNCWGFTAYYLQWEESAYWMDADQMKDYLQLRTKPISKEDAKAGDIAVFYSGNYLTHTAIILPGGDVICHKPGGQELCIDTIESAAINYGSVTYVRVIKESEERI